jgi:hypothetical protein
MKSHLETLTVIIVVVTVSAMICINVCRCCGGRFSFLLINKSTGIHIVP